jgi:dTDP-4-amino-4,6-dideoxygalactose transaminase
MPNVDAALTLVQLDRMPQILDGLRAATRRVIAEVLEPAGVEPAPPGHAELLTRMHVVDPRSRVDRTADRVVRHGALRQHLAANGVDTQYGYALLAGPGEADRLPTASSVADRLVRIPCHETLTDGQLARLRDLLAWYFRGRHWQ